MRRTWLVLPLLAVGAIAFSGISGCKRPRHGLKAYLGEYDGMVRTESGADVSSEGILHGSLQGSGKPPGKKELLLKVDGAATFDVAVDFSSYPRVRMSSEGLFGGAIELRPEEPASKDCLHTQPEAPMGVRMCFDGSELSFLVERPTQRTWVLLQKRGAALPTLEEPKAYTLAEVVDRAKNQSFESQDQFLTAVQSRLSARYAHLQLLPHVTANDILSLITFQWTALLRMVGDLAPFLLPQNWYAAAAAQHQSEADFYAWLAMKAGAANIAQGLGLSILRDESALQLLANYVESVDAFRQTLLERERLGLLPRGASHPITGTWLAAGQARELLQQAVTEEYRALAQAAGFISPSAIIRLTGGLPVESPTAKTPEEAPEDDTWAKLALLRSPELRQMAELMKVATYQRVKRYFFWMDPSGDGVGIGAGFTTYFELGRIPERKMLLQRDKVASIVLQKTTNALTERATALRTSASARQARDVQNERVAQLQQSMRLGILVPVTDLQLAFQDALKAEMDVINAEFAYRMASANLDRMAFKGPYVELLSLVAQPGGRPLPRP